MKVASAPSPVPDVSRAAPPLSWLARAAPLLIAVAVVLIYGQTLPCPFQFDDVGSILANTSLHDFWSWHWLVPPSASGETVGGRPVLNLSFALNHALGGVAVEGYRGVNILIHVLAALTLYGVAWRVAALRASSLAGGSSADAGTSRRLFSVGLALLWACHPLQTGAVTYIVQRAESLAGLLYLVTVYCFLRGVWPGSPASPRATGRAGWGWFVLAALAGFAGAGAKETIATAPLMVLLLDRALVSGGFVEAWRRHWGLYIALAASWMFLAWLVAADPTRGGSAGFASAVDVPTYFLTQCRAVPRYLHLVVWPSGLVFDYGVSVVRSPWEVVPQIVILTVAGGAAVVLVACNRIEGVLLGGFFLLLAPSSSFVPVSTQTIAEHRMYLPLAAILALGGVLVDRLIRAVRSVRIPWWGLNVPVGLGVLALGLTTVARNQTYRSALVLWEDTVAKNPDNPRAHHNLGLELVRVGRGGEAGGEFRRAIELQPNHAFAHAWLAVVLLEQGSLSEAVVHLRAALAADSHYGFAWLQLGHALLRSEHLDEAGAAYENAVRCEPRNADAHFGLAVVLAQQRRVEPALVEFRRVLELEPARIDARANLGNCLLLTGRAREAIEVYEKVLQLTPDDEAARRNLELAREYLAR